MYITNLEAMKNDEDLASMYEKSFEEIELSEYIQGEIKWIAIGGNVLSLASITAGNFEIGEIEGTLKNEGTYTMASIFLMIYPDQREH